MSIRAFVSLLAIGALAACVRTESPPEPFLIDRPSGAVHWADIDPRAIDHVNRRLDEIERQPRLEGGVLFLGDSITEGAPLSAMFPRLDFRNQGIGWDTSDGVLLRLNQVTRHAPDRIFLLIGTNDTDYTDDSARIASNIERIADHLREALPSTQLYVVSVLPRHAPNNATIPAVNAQVSAAAKQAGFVYLDLASAMRAPDGEMNPALSYDNLHLNVHGYAVWEEVLRSCVWDGCPDGL